MHTTYKRTTRSLRGAQAGASSGDSAGVSFQRDLIRYGSV